MSLLEFQIQLPTRMLLVIYHSLLICRIAEVSYSDDLVAEPGISEPGGAVELLGSGIWGLYFNPLFSQVLGGENKKHIL